MQLTINQKRFLIIWVFFHSFALFVNLADIECRINSSFSNSDVVSLSEKSNNKLDSIKSDSLDDLIKKSLYRVAKLKENDSTETPYKGNYDSPLKKGASGGTDIIYQKANSNIEYSTCLFTSGSNQPDFWPFTSYTSIGYGTTTTHYFYGIFNGYGFSEYVFYIFLGLAIVFVPKLWN